MRADQLYQDIINARTFSEIQAAINDAAPVDYDANPQLIRAQLPPRQEQLIGPEGSRHEVADSSAHQPHPGQGAAYEGFSLWLQFTYHSVQFARLKQL